MAKLPPRPKRVKGATREELLLLDKSELVEKIIQLEAHNLQLKNIINKKMSEGSTSGENEKKRPFDFSACHYRKVLLRIMYFGWDYQGLAVQEDSNQTIEHHLFHALTKSCLIESRETSQYHRCGRTDKGVSAFGQVISIRLRSKYPPEQQNSETVASEMPYCKILNRLLPKDIRAIAWMPIPEDRPDYSARFDCKKRKYKYYFPRSDLRLDAMREGASNLVGNHDFRNLCKMDVGNGVTEFRRTVLSADIVAVEGDNEDPTSMLCLIIEGNAFLWHQIRCIMAVLLMVGQGQESPDAVKKLLDVETYPRKPQYNLALDVPLNLFHCSYELEDEQNWHFNQQELKSLITELQHVWTIHNIKTTMIKDALQHLEAELTKMGEDRVCMYTQCLLQGVRPKLFKPLFERDTCQSLEEMIEFYKKKRKISPDE